MRNRRQRAALKPVPLATGRREVIEAAAEEVLADGRVRVVTASGEPLVCRVPMHISLPWLRAALVRGPVPAEVTVSDGGTSSLWALFPGPEHEGVVPGSVEIAASEAIHLVCGTSKITMAAKELRVRSRDVTVSGSRATRVRGGTVKLN
jgi:head-tail adaptor